MPTQIRWRAFVAFAAAVALSLVTLIVASPAGAATIYACVKKKGGSVRIVAERSRCKRHEVKLAWNTEGPGGKNGLRGLTGKTGAAGRTGLTGKEGPAGSNGAVAGLSVSNAAFTKFTGQSQVMVVSRPISAGNYIVSAKTVISSTADTAVKAGAICELVAGGAVLDTAQWIGPLAELKAGEFTAGSTLSTLAALSTPAATTVSLECSDQSADASAQVIGASFSQITLVQTTSNS